MRQLYIRSLCYKKTKEKIWLSIDTNVIFRFYTSLVAKRALGYSHILEESKLKLHLFVPEEPREVK